jgi:hypothetical protein
MIRITALLLGALTLFSCGEILLVKPTDWDMRQSFSKKPYTGELFEEWDYGQGTRAAEINADDCVKIDKSQRWKGGGTLPHGSQAYYMVNAANAVTIAIDWRYREDDGIEFAYKKVGSEGENDYSFSTVLISMEKNEYLVIRISAPDIQPDSFDWEIGFIVK